MKSLTPLYSFMGSAPIVLVATLTGFSACSPASPARGEADPSAAGGENPQLPTTEDNIVIPPDEGGPVGGGSADERDLPLRSEVCDAAGNCTCLRLALLGTLDSSAVNSDSGPFVEWLNGNSGGSAVVDMVTTKPDLNAEFLMNYDILLVANVNTWAFSAEEKAAVTAWSQESGGGIISLTGFVSDSAEPAATSQLIEFSGLSYTGAIAAEGGQNMVPVYYGDDQTTDRSKCLTSPQNREAQITTAIRFEPLGGTMETLTANLDYVGAFIGFGINAPDDATVVATDPMSSQPIAVAKEVNAKGRVFAWGDEWVIFKNQWQDPGPSDDTNMNENNVCWQPDETEADGFFLTVQSLYQSKQFWYNIISWVAPPNECFVIEDEEVTVVLR